jgi:Domain of unknown function (DUF4352)
MDRWADPSNPIDRLGRALDGLGWRRMGKRAIVGRGLVWTGLLMLVVVGAVGWVVTRGKPAPVVAGRAPARSISSSRTSSGQASVSADSVTWQILSSHTTRRIENEYLPASTAHGVYLIMDVTATNGTSSVVNLANDHLDLDLGGTEYPLDATALSSLELAGHKALSGATLDPEGTAQGWLVFDVPPAAIRSTPRLCLGTQAIGAARTPAAAGCVS